MTIDMYNVRRFLTIALAVACLGLAIMWPGWRAALAQGYTVIGQASLLGCGTSRHTGELVVTLSDSSGPNALTFSQGTLCTEALKGYNDAGWFIQKEDQFLSRGRPGFAVLYRLTRP